MNAAKVNPTIDVFATVLMLQYENTFKTQIEYTPNPNVRTGRDYMFLDLSQSRCLSKIYIQAVFS